MAAAGHCSKHRAYSQPRGPGALTVRRPRPLPHAGPRPVSAATPAGLGVRHPSECPSRAQQRPLPRRVSISGLGPGPRGNQPQLLGRWEVSSALPAPPLSPRVGWALCPSVPPCSLAGLSLQPHSLSGSGACLVWEACVGDPCRWGWGCALRLKQCDEEYSRGRIFPRVLHGLQDFQKSPKGGHRARSPPPPHCSRPELGVH